MKITIESTDQITHIDGDHRGGCARRGIRRRVQRADQSTRREERGALETKAALLMDAITQARTRISAETYGDGLALPGVAP